MINRAIIDWSVSKLYNKYSRFLNKLQNIVQTKSRLIHTDLLSIIAQCCKEIIAEQLQLSFYKFIVKCLTGYQLSNSFLSFSTAIAFDLPSYTSYITFILFY